MKKLVSTIFAYLILVNAMATVRTVSADPNQPAQFTSLQAAHDASLNDDTVQWYGANSVGSLSLSKRLTIIGLETSPNYPHKPYVSCLGQSCSGSKFISGRYNQISNDTYENPEIQVSNVIVDVISNLSLLAVNCVVGEIISLPQLTISVNFSNCLFTSTQDIGSQWPFIYLNTTVNSSNYVFDHCVFFGELYVSGSPSGNNTSANYLTNVIFSNCILNSINVNTCFDLNTAFDHSLFVGFSLDNTEFCGVLVGSNSIMNAPDPFVNGNLSNLATADFRLNATSAGNNAGSDGTDIGMHGGNQSWPISYHYGLVPPGVPVVNTLTLDNYVIGVSDSLQMNVQGSIPSNQ